MVPLPTVSIITVVRDDAPALSATIKSVRAQSYRPIEFVVVDGQSTDGTVAVIRAAAPLLDKWVSEPDGGLYDAMNKGKRMASGDFAMFVNAGDTFIDQDAIAQMVARIGDWSKLYFGSVRLTDCTGRLSWEVPPRRSGQVNPTRSYLPHHQSILYPRVFFAFRDYEPAMGYRADVHYTATACEMLEREFVDIKLIQSTLGGVSSRAISSFAELRREMLLETAFARHVAETTGNRLMMLRVGANVIVKYLASKTGGLPLVHRLMYANHKLSSLALTGRDE